MAEQLDTTTSKSTSDRSTSVGGITGKRLDVGYAAGLAFKSHILTSLTESRARCQEQEACKMQAYTTWTDDDGEPSAVLFNCQALDEQCPDLQADAAQTAVDRIDRTCRVVKALLVELGN